MKRNVDLNEITDGSCYGLNDLVRADCCDCAGCSECCRKMADTIILDPLDCFRLAQALSCSFDELLSGGRLELNMVDGIVLPNLKPRESDGCCPFLNAAGRCSIHAFRPGFCRMFPLGRYYQERTFSYILQTKECPKNRSKIRVSKWLDTPELQLNQKFVGEWHYFLEDIYKSLIESPPETQRQAQLFLLHCFYRTPYTAEGEASFYAEFAERLDRARVLID